MAAALGRDFAVVAEGLGGRTTVFDDPIDGAHLNGLSYLRPCLASHKPLDLVIIMLGTNDLKHRFGVLADDIARAAGRLVERVQSSDAGLQSCAPEVLLVAPAPILEVGDTGVRFSGGAQKSQQLGIQYAKVATDLGCHFLDAGKHIRSSGLDGIHLDLDAHQTLGHGLAGRVFQILG